MSGSLRRRYGVGLIGCGTIAWSAHLPALAALEQHARLVAVADRRADVAEAAAREYGAEAWSVDHRAVIEREDVDVVFVLTPEALHRGHVVDSLRAGKHVLCEKPMARTLEDADAMLAAARETGRCFMIAHSRRFNDRYRRLRALVEAGEVGDVCLFRENVRRPRSQYAGVSRGVGAWQPEGGQTWHSLPQFSGGAFHGLGIHEFDLMRWFVGAAPRSVYAEGRIAQAGGQVPNVASATVRFANGALGVADMYEGLPEGYPFYHTTEVVGTSGVLRASDPEMVSLRMYRDGAMHHVKSYEMLMHIVSVYQAEQDAFLHAVDEGTPPPLNPADGRAALELALAAAQSAAQHRVVELPLTSEVTR